MRAIRVYQVQIDLFHRLLLLVRRQLPFRLTFGGTLLWYLDLVRSHHAITYSSRNWIRRVYLSPRTENEHSRPATSALNGLTPHLPPYPPRTSRSDDFYLQAAVSMRVETMERDVSVARCSASIRGQQLLSARLLGRSMARSDLASSSERRCGTRSFGIRQHRQGVCLDRAAVLRA